MRGLLIGAPASAQGKTTLTLGLLRALRRRGADVASAKSGPDYIDPAFHAAATGRPCLTLDAWAAGPSQLRARAAAQPADLLVVEGAMGLYDGAAVDVPAAGAAGPGLRDASAAFLRRSPDPPRPVAGVGRGDGQRDVRHGPPPAAPAEPAGATLGAPGSSAALAAALDIPVLLVVDVARMGQSVAALLHGLASFPDAPRIAGAVLNRAGSERHAAMVRRAAEAVCPVLGVLPRRDDLGVPSRHLGLVQAAEHPDLAAFLDRAADAVEAGCDVPAIAACAGPVAAPRGAPARLSPPGQRVAVARDAAFGFAYWHMLEDWRAAGAEIVPFSPLADQPPDRQADAVFLPGGYPELYPGRISDALGFHAGMRAAADRGATIYGECGGYMVLGDGLVGADGTRHAMLGLLRLETSAATPARVLGYRRLSPVSGGPWHGPLAGHEFRTAVTVRADGPPLFRVQDAAGADLGTAGLAEGRIAGSFAHVVELATE